MTAQNHHFPTPEQIARELSSQVHVFMYANDGSDPELEDFLEKRSRAADRNPIRSTTEWLCPTSLTIYEIDSRIAYAQSQHGERGELDPTTDPEIRVIVDHLRAGRYDDARDGIAQYYNESAHIPDDRIIAAWTPPDGARLAFTDLVKPGDDGEAHHLAADITACRDLAAFIERVVLSGDHPRKSLTEMHRVAMAADEAAKYCPLMIDIVDDLHVVIRHLIEYREVTAELREILGDIHAAHSSLVVALSCHRERLSRERDAIRF